MIDKQLLNAVVEMTGHRDLDSLELSLVQTIVEILNCRKVAICKRLNVQHTRVVEEAVSLLRMPNNQYSIKVNELIASPEQELLEGFVADNLISKSIDHQLYRYWIPVVRKEEETALVFIESDSLTSEQLTLLNGLVRIYKNYLLILSESERDKLTGLLNRQTFEKKFSCLLSKQRENQINQQSAGGNLRKLHSGTSAWLAIIDVDHFKRINDRFGHVCGDEVLLTLSQTMKSYFRVTDLLFRFGGEEFVAVLEPTTYSMAYRLFDHLREKVALTRFPLVKDISISLGFTQVVESHFSLALLEQADKALYFAKENGRNQIQCYEDLVSDCKIPAKTNNNEIDIF